MRGDGWVITKSYVGGKLRQKVGKNHTIPFRLLDDDKNVYFSGFMTKELYNSPEIFDPLDATKFVYGCTELQVLNKNKTWETI